MDVPVWLLWLGGVCGALLTVLAFTRTVVSLLSDAVGDVIDRKVGNDLSYIRTELSMNGGRSTKDVVIKLERWAGAVDVRLDNIDSYITEERRGRGSN